MSRKNENIITFEDKIYTKKGSEDNFSFFLLLYNFRILADKRKTNWKILFMGRIWKFNIQ